MTRAWMVLACLLVAAPVAAQQRASIRVEVDGLFGEGTIADQSYVPLLVTLENPTARDLAGELELRVKRFDGSASHRARVEVPAGRARTSILTVFVPLRATDIEARFAVGGRTIGRGTASVTPADWTGSVVVLGDPPRLRGALLDLDVVLRTLDGSLRSTRVPVGVVPMDARSGDPLLPDDAAAWSSVGLLVASVPVLSRATEAQREAIADWLRTGGRLLVIPRSAADLTDRFVRDLMGNVGAEESVAASALVPDGVPRLALRCSEAQRVESFGCSAPVGLGRVFLASYDAMSVAAIESGVPRELVRSVYAASQSSPAALPFGRGYESLDGMDYAFSRFDALRVALDPNEGFRPALALAALVLLLYVVVVGPINFRWVQQKNRPTLALVTTPLAALGCVLALLIVGYIGKGVSMRYRRVELVELVEGQRRAPARRYTGLYATRPGAFDLPATSGGEAHRIHGAGESGPIYVHEADGVHLTGFRAGLWETVFLREDRVVDVGGAIRFERDGRRLASVVNDTPHPLTHAFVIDGTGAVYRVGAIAAGGSAPIPRRSVGSLSRGGYYGDYEIERLTEPGEHRPYLRGLAHLAGPSFVPARPEAPVLYAHVSLDPTSIGEVFAHEADHRWIRVIASTRGAAVTPNPSTADFEDPYAIPQPDARASGAPSDAGVTDAGTEVAP